VDNIVAACKGLKTSDTFKALVKCTVAVANYLNHQPGARGKVAYGFKMKEFANFCNAKTNKVEGFPVYPNGTAASVEFVIKAMEKLEMLDKEELARLQGLLGEIKKVKVWSLENDIDLMGDRISSISEIAATVATFPPEEKVQDNFHKVALACAAEASQPLADLNVKQQSMYDEFYSLAGYFSEDPFDKELPFSKDKHMLQCILDGIGDVLDSAINTMANWQKNEAIMGKAMLASASKNAAEKEGAAAGEGLISTLANKATNELEKQGGKGGKGPPARRGVGGRLSTGNAKGGKGKGKGKGKGGKGGKAGAGGDDEGDNDDNGDGAGSSKFNFSAARAAKGGPPAKGGKGAGPKGPPAGGPPAKGKSGKGKK